MIDRFGRTLDYLRVSVTDRCNLRCRYCMPPEGVSALRHEDILSFEEIEQVVREAVAMGVTKVRLTGGEPLIRRGVIELVRILAAIEGINDLAMSSNGTLLAPVADELKGAGLQRVNISLDAIDADHYAEITRGGSVADVLAGIDAAVAAGLLPVKLNCVVTNSSDEPDARDVARFAAEKKLELRFIRRMDLSEGSFSIVEGGRGGDCPACNRLRLTSNGYIRPCLFSNLRFSVRELGVREALTLAAARKPRMGSACTDTPMCGIGG